MVSTMYSSMEMAESSFYKGVEWRNQSGKLAGTSTCRNMRNFPENYISVKFTSYIMLMKLHSGELLS